MKPNRIPLILFLITSAISPSAASDWTEGSVPGWVITAEPRFAGSDVSARQGFEYGLIETQMNAEMSESFRRFTCRVISEAGLEEAAGINIEFDPSYQSVVIHYIRILRDGAVLERLSPDFFRTLQREKDLEANLYLGTLTLHGNVSDLRKGDTVDYAFTVRGGNPVFRGKFSAEAGLLYSVPYGRRYVRLLASADRALSMKFTGKEYPVMRRTAGGLQEWVLDLQDMEAVDEEPDLPSWFDPYDSLFVTEWRSWAEVSSWAQSLYATDSSSGEEIAGLAAKLTARFPDAEERALAALRFVQDEIRYYGIELGTGSHGPREPSETLLSRFGDCKDKARLLCTLLGAAGIDSSPVLVHTRKLEKIALDLPSPFSFNHVIVRIEPVPGKTCFVDPTIILQGGTLYDRPYDYGAGLVVRPGAEELMKIGDFVPEQPIEERQEQYISTGFAAPATYDVRLTLRSYLADSYRYYASLHGEKELQKAVVDRFLDDNPSLVLQGDMRYRDDRRANEMTISLSFSYPGAWVKDEKRDRMTFSVYPHLVGGYLYAPEDYRNRTMPFGLFHPAWVEQNISILLHEAWPKDRSSDTVESGFFSFAAERETGYGRAMLRYEYRSRSAEAYPRMIEKLSEKVKDARGFLGYELYAPVRTAGSEKKPAADVKPAQPLPHPLPAVIVNAVLFFLIMFVQSLDR